MKRWPLLRWKQSEILTAWKSWVFKITYFSKMSQNHTVLSYILLVKVQVSIFYSAWGADTVPAQSYKTGDIAKQRERHSFVGSLKSGKGLKEYSCPSAINTRRIPGVSPLLERSHRSSCLAQDQRLSWDKEQYTWNHLWLEHLNGNKEVPPSSCCC